MSTPQATFRVNDIVEYYDGWHRRTNRGIVTDVDTREGRLYVSLAGQACSMGFPLNTADEHLTLVGHIDTGDLPAAGDSVRHYKGGLYVVVGVAKDEAGEVGDRVVYRSTADGKLWMRSPANWLQAAWDGTQYVRRFTVVAPKLPAWLARLSEADREKLADMPPIGFVPEEEPTT